MSHTPFILAAGDELPIKLIFYGIIGVIWLVGAVASKLRKSGSAPAQLPPSATSRRPGTAQSDPSRGPAAIPTMAALLQSMRADTPRMRELGMRQTQPMRYPQPAQTRRPAIDRSQAAIVQQAQSLRGLAAQPVRSEPLPLPPVAQAAAPMVTRAAGAISKTSRAGAGLDQPLTARFGHRSAALGDLGAMLQPGLLARQLVLSEILRPPLALRDPDERGV